MSTQPTIWKRAPHTEVKHRILREYLNAWYPKLQWARRVVFIDGFAGPGVYSEGELGSPLIAVEAAINHKANLDECELLYIFVEKDRPRYEHLKEVIDGIDKPRNVRCRTVHGEFTEELGKILDDIEAREKQLAPALVMVDPFGFAGVPLELLARVAKHDRSEFLISFMYESISRWLGHPKLEETFDRLFGCADWRDAIGMEPPETRRSFLIELYVRQIKAIGFEYVPPAFQMLDEGKRTEYFLLFASHSKDGLKAMKYAMWKADPSGRFRFSDASDAAQLDLIKPEPDFDDLKARIVGKFSGSEASVEEIEDFVLCDTLYRESHYKRQILVPMERDQELEVVKSDRQKARTFPAGTIIRFA